MRFVIATLALGTLPAISFAGDIDAKKFGWYTDYDVGRAEAKRTGKPMLVAFRCEP